MKTDLTFYKFLLMKNMFYKGIDNGRYNSTFF